MGRALVILALLLTSCGTNPPDFAPELVADSTTDTTPQIDSAEDGIPTGDSPLDGPPTGDVTPAGPFIAGEDLDERPEKPLAAAYAPPQEFYDALDAMGVPVSKLTWPDLGWVYEIDPSRLHWTDTIRHQGDRAPVFAAMVIEDVEAALALDSSPAGGRELLAAMGTYNARDAYRTSRYDRAITVEGPTPLMDALKVFYQTPTADGGAGTDLPPWEEQAASVEPILAEVPLTVRVALAQALLGLLEAAALRDMALTHKGVFTIDEWGVEYGKFATGADFYTDKIMKAAQLGLDLEYMIRSGQVAFRSLLDLQAALTKVPPSPGVVFEIVGPLGRIKVDLDDAATVWEHEDGFLLVDRAGDDIWRGRVAGTTSVLQPISTVVDVAGSDLYEPLFPWGIDAPSIGYRQPAQGAGVYGVAILVDGAGDDDYGTPSNGQGFGAFGVGVLADLGGDDTYRAYDWAQGAAEFGYGLLLDRGEGKDDYETLQRSQGYGGPRGMGWLVDEGGDDHYLAVPDPIVWDWAGEGHNFTGGQGFGFGDRSCLFQRGAPCFSGGLGALFDLGGDDVYQCSVMCQAFGYFFGTGLLYDATGDDDYTLTHKYGQGAATHQSAAVFWDGDGADAYRNIDDDECTGLGYDHGVAWHIDRGDGPDIYTIDNAGNFVFGFARHPALGVLINEGGDDEYHIPGNGNRALGRAEADENDHLGGCRG